MVQLDVHACTSPLTRIGLMLLAMYAPTWRRVYCVLAAVPLCYQRFRRTGLRTHDQDACGSC
jgi:hypothetical protein